MQRILDFIKANNYSRIAIFSHMRGDGDCLGAQTGLAEILISAGLCVDMYNQEILPENLSFLYRFENITKADSFSAVPDVCIAVDCASFERIGELPEAFKQKEWINIDHHISNTNFGVINIVDGEASSTCEVLTRMAQRAQMAITKETATSLYTGISTDTGSFMYPNATQETFELAAFLLASEADKSLVQANVFENTSRKQMNIYGYLYSNIRFMREDKVAYAVFSYELLQDMKATSADLDGVVSLIKQIAGVELAILFTELKKGQCKISLRTKDYFDANKFCAGFGGGGHVRASGATITDNLQSATEKVLNEINCNWEEYIDVK